MGHTSRIVILLSSSKYSEWVLISAWTMVSKCLIFSYTLLLISFVGRWEPCSSSWRRISSGCHVTFRRLCRNYSFPSKSWTIDIVNPASQINTDFNWCASECEYWVWYVENSIIRDMLLNCIVSQILWNFVWYLLKLRWQLSSCCLLSIRPHRGIHMNFQKKNVQKNGICAAAFLIGVGGWYLHWRMHQMIVSNESQTYLVHVLNYVFFIQAHP